MTQKEQIYATIETFLEDNDIGNMTFPSELSAELADRIAALPLDVPGDEERIKEQSEYLTDKEERAFYAGQKWMKNEILKRNRP